MELSVFTLCFCIHKHINDLLLTIISALILISQYTKHKKACYSAFQTHSAKFIFSI